MCPELQKLLGNAPLYYKYMCITSIYLLWCRKVTADNEVGEVRYNNDTSVLQTQTVPQTMPYSTPMPLTHLQMECMIGSDGYLIPNKHKMENTDFPVPYIDFDDASLKSIINDKIEGNSQVEMQPNPSYFKTDIPDDSTEV